MSPKKQNWSSGTGFIMATAGAAIGLGNLWRFPFLAGENGGGLFVLFYLLSVVMIALPIMMGELVIGRAGRGSAIGSVNNLTGEGKASKLWRIMGSLSVIIPFFGIAYYSVVGGWVIDYTFTAILGDAGLASPEISKSRFETMLADPLRLLLAHSVFMLAVIFVLINGVQRGIERVSKILMPGLFLFIIALVIYASIYADFMRTVEFLFMPNFSEISGKVILLAVGQSFFSLAIGVGIMITYGAYIPEGVSLKKSVLIIGGMDTFVAVTAGLAIFPFVFSNGLDPSGGPGLIFITLPTAFGQMTSGALVGLVFFLLLFSAAFSTGIGTLEPVVAWMAEQKGMTRKSATWISGISAWAVGIIALLSFNVWRDVKPLDFIPIFEGKSIFDSLDFTIASILLPVNGVLIALFVGWALDKKVLVDLDLSPLMQNIWKWLLRLIVPLAIIIITITG